MWAAKTRPPSESLGESGKADRLQRPDTNASSGWGI